MWNSLGVHPNSEQGESVLAGQTGLGVRGGGAQLSLADSEWAVGVESGLPGARRWSSF